MRGDLSRVTGQPVQRLGQRFDVLDDPGDAILQQDADRIRDHGKRIESGTDPAESQVDPTTVRHAAGDHFDVLGDADAGQRILRGHCAPVRPMRGPATVSTS
jgi:hypothetical protein